jgi:hypothetical protein
MGALAAQQFGVFLLLAGEYWRRRDGHLMNASTA